METSDALDLARGVFALDDPAAIARSLKRSAEESHRRKSTPFRSALSMLTFYINRGGSKLPARRKRILERAKDELRRPYKRPPSAAQPSTRRSPRAAQSGAQRSKRSTQSKRAARATGATSATSR
jgi:hypothetical protein